LIFHVRNRKDLEVKLPDFMARFNSNSFEIRLASSYSIRVLSVLAIELFCKKNLKEVLGES